MDQPPKKPAPPLASPAPGGAAELSFATSVRAGTSPVDRVRLQRRRLVNPVLLADTLPPFVEQPSFSTAGKVGARIVNGDIIDITEAPWQVRVNYGCGGTLIQSSWVMTAAHCVQGDRLRDIQVWAGISDRRFMTSRNSLGVKAVHIHKKWDPETFAHDIALLELATPASGTPVRLYAGDGPRRGTQARISGWGFLAYDSPPTPDELRSATIEVLAGPNGSCGDYTDRLFFSDVMLCAGSPDGSIDACQGDSGGPLAIAVDDEWYVAGITSWGTECALPGFPGVYTRVSRFVPWIHRTIGWRDVATIRCSKRTSCTSALVEGLTSGDTYVHRIRARNAAGWSKWSNPSVAATAG
jgi:hypothetical protein